MGSGATRSTPPTRSALQKINYYLEVNKIDYKQEGHKNRNQLASRSPKPTSIRRALQKSNLPQGHRNRPHPSRNQNPKESLKTEGQKAIPYNHESKTTIAIQPFWL